MYDIIRDITEISRCGAQYRAEVLAPLGLKGCHAGYLAEICAHPGLSQEQLAARICINKSNVARQAVILEENGFIVRRTSATDKRVMELYPTQKAQELLPKLEPVLQSWEAELTEEFTDRERETFAALLGRMRGKAAAWMANR